MRLIARAGDLTPKQRQVYTSIQTAVKIYVSDIAMQPYHIFLAPNLFDIVEEIYQSLLTEKEREDPPTPVQILGLVAVYDLKQPDNSFCLYPRNTNECARRHIMYFKHPLGENSDFVDENSFNKQRRCQFTPKIA